GDGDGLPGGHRELQRLVAGPGLVAVPPCLGDGSVRPLGAACHGPAAASAGTDRGGPGTTPVPHGVEAGLASDPAGAVDLSATGRWSRRCGGVGPPLAGVGALAASAGAGWGGPGRGTPPVLPPSAAPTPEPAPGLGSAVPTAPETLPGVIGMFWQLSFCTHASVRNVLAVVRLLRDGVPGREERPADLPRLRQAGDARRLGPCRPDALRL